MHHLVLTSLLEHSSEKHHGKLLACLRTASQSRVSPWRPGPVLAAEPVCRPRRCEAETERAAPRRGTDAAPAGGRSETETPGSDCARHCSGGDRK